MKINKKIGFFKLLSLVFILIPCFFAFSGCSLTSNTQNSITISTDGYWVINGEKTDVKARGEDGKDGEIYQDYSIEEIYQAFVANGYTEDFENFFLEYFNMSLDLKQETTQNCITSVVTIENNYNLLDPKKGSGVVIQKNSNGDAYILTNYHVCYPISNTLNYTIYLSSDENKQSPIEATYVFGNENKDLAILKVENNSNINSATVAQLASNNAEVGTTCIAIGNPSSFRDGMAVTDGVVGVETEQVAYNAGGGTKPRTVLRHNAFIAPGCSGGGLFNLRGELVGINCAGETDSKYLLVNYAIPVEVINEFLNSFFNNL